MATDLVAVASIQVVGNVFFGHFERGTPLWRRVTKWILLLALTAGLSSTTGHAGVVAFLLACLVAAVVVHGWWLPKQGINGWTGEPREVYERLRGWR